MSKTTRYIEKQNGIEDGLGCQNPGMITMLATKHIHQFSCHQTIIISKSGTLLRMHISICKSWDGLPICTQHFLMLESNDVFIFNEYFLVTFESA